MNSKDIAYNREIRLHKEESKRTKINGQRNMNKNVSLVPKQRKSSSINFILWLIPQAEKKKTDWLESLPWYKTIPATPSHNYINFKQ